MAVHGFKLPPHIELALGIVRAWERLMPALRSVKIDQHVIIGGPIQFDAKGQNVNIKAAAIQNLHRKPTVVMPKESAVGELVWPMPGWNDKRRT